MITRKTIGDHLREWRGRRRMSQLALAMEADISARHLSFVETGRAQPSREMVLHLAERLNVPLRERNALLVAAGYAPVYPELSIDAPQLSAARHAVKRVLQGHEPFPALAVDRHWAMIEANGAVAPLLYGIDASLLRPPVNVLRLSLHPQGLAPRIANLAEWRSHLLTRLRGQIQASADDVLTGLLEELRHYPASNQLASRRAAADADAAGVFVPLRLVTEAGTLNFISTTTVFGTPAEVTLSELALECFFPSDAATAEILRAGPLREGRSPTKNPTSLHVS